MEQVSKLCVSAFPSKSAILSPAKPCLEGELREPNGDGSLRRYEQIVRKAQQYRLLPLIKWRL